MTGRRPKTTSLKLTDGNPGKRPLNKKEPKPKAARNAPPTWLTGPAKTTWKKIAPGMIKDGRLTVESVDALGCYCQNMARLVRIEKEISGGKAIPDRSDMATMKELQMLILRLAGEFGFTPASRSRIVTNVGEAGDDLADFLKVKHG